LTVLDIVLQERTTTLEIWRNVGIITTLSSNTYSPLSLDVRLWASSNGRVCHTETVQTLTEYPMNFEHRSKSEIRNKGFDLKSYSHSLWFFLLVNCTDLGLVQVDEPILPIRIATNDSMEGCSIITLERIHVVNKENQAYSDRNVEQSPEFPL